METSRQGQTGFLEKWSHEYQQELQNRTRKQKTVAVGDLVVIKENNMPPLQWQLHCMGSNRYATGTPSVKVDNRVFSNRRQLLHIRSRAIKTRQYIAVQRST